MSKTENQQQQELDPTAPASSSTSSAETDGKKKGGSKKARVLVDCQIEGQHCKVNDVVSASADVISEAERLGHVDSNKAAVSYAESLQQPKGEAKG